MKASSVTVYSGEGARLALRALAGFGNAALFVVLVQGRRRAVPVWMLNLALSVQPGLCSDVLLPLFVACVIC